MQGFSERYELALTFAARAHRAQLRKGSDIPYIAHVVHVSTILARHGFAEDLVVAGLLHDVVEDCDISLAEVRELAGDAVARLVGAVSEQKLEGGAERPWEQRKAEGLAHLRVGGPDIAALKAADAIHNMRTTAIDLRTHGPALWERFKRGPAQTLWYYREILVAVRAQLSDHPIVAELAGAVADLETASAEGAPDQGT
jgi:(p)ppGpp synthase/HD superfamily hydrolase